jgi:hypothetical protein
VVISSNGAEVSMAGITVRLGYFRDGKSFLYMKNPILLGLIVWGFTWLINR